MQTPSTATLRQLTEAVNARVAEEFELFDMPVTPPKLSPGIVRAAWQVMAEAIAVDLETESLRDEVVSAMPAGQRIRIESEARMIEMINALASQLADDPATATTEDDGADDADPYDEAERMVKAEIAERAERLEALVEKIREAETPEPEHTPTAPKSTPRRSQFSDIPPDKLKAKAYAFIRSLAPDGIMPRGSDYDATRPEDLPGRMRLIQLLGLSWGEIAAELGLTMLTPTQRMNRSKEAEREQEQKAAAVEPEPRPTPQPTLPRIPDVQVVPARVVMAEPLKPKPAESSFVEQQSFARRKLRVDFFDFLRKIAVDSVMPSQEEYNERKPDALPNARDAMNRLAYTNWLDIAKDAGLVTKARRAAEKAVASRRQRQVA